MFRLESDTAPGPSQPDGGMPATPDGGTGGPTPRPLAALTENGPWLRRASGLAVDAAHHVYVSDNSTVYVIDDAGTSSPYLTLAEVASTAGLATAQTIFDIDVGPDGKLYVLLSNGLLADATRTDTIVTSSAAHQATRLGDLAPLTRARMAVMGTGSVGYYTLGEFWSATAAGTQNIYTAAALGWDTEYCVIGDVLISGSGTVAFLPSCSWRPIQVGTVSGGPLGTLYPPIDPAAFSASVSGVARMIRRAASPSSSRTSMEDTTRASSTFRKRRRPRPCRRRCRRSRHWARSASASPEACSTTA